MTSCEPEFARWLVDSLNSGVLAIDVQRKVVVYNDVAQRILTGSEVSREAWQGRTVEVVLEAQPRLAGLLVQGLDGKQRPSRAELLLEPSADQPARTIGLSLFPIRTPDSSVQGSFMLFRDLTPYERMDEQERLRDRLAALGQMAAGLAHELRNPLAGLEILAGLLRRRLEARAGDRALVDELIDGIHDIAHTLDRGLEFVRPLGADLVPVDPAKLVDESLGRAQARFEFAGAIERNFAADLPALRADPDQIRSALTDLMVNAFQAMRDVDRPEGHRLRVGLRVATDSGSERAVRVAGDGLPASELQPNPRELVITITDTGPGISEEIGEKIFYPFFTTKSGGSGIGLATAQKVVAGHRGTLSLQSREGRGTVFEIRLPVVDFEG